MEIITAQNILYEIKDRELLKIPQLSIASDAKIGIVGKNGSGKTTLLNILAKQILPTSGSVHADATMAFVPQLKAASSTMSGGEWTQAHLDRVLSQTTDVLFLDEPTTNLDIDHVRTLEKALQRRHGALVIVSHDRAFLDALCTMIWEIHDGCLTIYKGNYSDYAKQKELELQQHQQAFEAYMSKKRQLEEALELKKRKAARATKKPKKTSLSEANQKGVKPYFAKKQKKLDTTAKALETRIENLEKVEKPYEEPSIRMSIPGAEKLKSRVIIRMENGSCTIGDKLLWENATFQIKAGEKVAIVGKNGAGKTTLLKKLVEKKDEAIRCSPAMKIGYFSQNLDVLQLEESILENTQSSSVQPPAIVRTVLARLHFFGDDVYKLVQDLSGGERVKAALAKLFVSDVNTLVLDEPTNYLDITAMEALEGLLQAYEGTVIFVSHDRQFVENIAERKISIAHQEICTFSEPAGVPDAPERSVEKSDSDDALIVLETKIAAVLSRLSVDPSSELEEEFQQLVKEKKSLLK